MINGRRYLAKDSLFEREYIRGEERDVCFRTSRIDVGGFREKLSYLKNVVNVETSEC